MNCFTRTVSATAIGVMRAVTFLSGLYYAGKTIYYYSPVQVERRAEVRQSQWLKVAEMNEDMDGLFEANHR